MYALRVQEAGLFEVSELHLPTWSLHAGAQRSATHLAPYVQLVPAIEKIVLRPGLEDYARRASDVLSLLIGRPILVETRSLICFTPWQKASSTLLRKWLVSDWPVELTYSFNAHLAAPTSPVHQPPIGPGFDFPLGESTDEEDSTRRPISER